MTVLVAYASKHGSTEEVARELAATLGEAGVETELRLARSVRKLDGYDAVVLGAPLYMGRWHRDAGAFVRRHRETLERLPLAVFALGPVDDKPESWASAQQQLDKALDALPDVAPAVTTLFGGAVKPEELRFPFSHMPAADIRDWEAIRAWSEALPELLGLGAYAPSSRPWAMA